MKLRIIKKGKSKSYATFESTDSKWEAWCKKVAENNELWGTKKRNIEPAPGISDWYQRKHPIYDFEDVVERGEIEPEHVRDFLSFTYGL